MIIYATIVFVVGLAIGSFLNVLIFRIDDLESVIKTRSHCPHCKKVLSWFELIPLLSFIFLLGRCKDCKEKISIQYPAVELGTAGLFLLLFYLFGISWQMVFYAIVFSILIVIFVYDIKKQLIADELTWVTLILVVLGQKQKVRLFAN